MFHPSRALIAAALLLVAAAAHAQQPWRLEIGGGRVSIHADNVPLRTILSEWARLGGTRIINIERVTTAPVSLDLNGVSERVALDTLLRNVAGYVLAARAPSGPGASAFDRIVILPSSSAPRLAPPPTFANGPATRVPQPQPQPSAQNDPEENPDVDVAPGQPVRPRGAIFPPRPNALPVPDGEATQPDPPDPTDADRPGALVVTPGNPFGVPRGSSALPGVVTPVPEPQQPQRPNIQAPD